MLQVIRLMKGYLTIKVWGFSPERFMNLCSNHNILLWEIKYCSTYYLMNVGLKDFYNLKGITKKTGTRVVITKRYGLPFLFAKAGKRKAFILGLLCSLIFWVWMSGYIWTIEIEGNYYVTTDLFIDFLEQSSVQTGMRKSKLDIEKLEKEIRTKFGIVTWTSARVDGTKLLIQVKENDNIKSDQISTGISESEGMDLVAHKEGVIVSMVTRRGIPKVKIGDTIQKGDILVEGAVPIMNDDATVNHYNFCRADADILLRSVYTFKKEINEKYQIKEYTSKEKKQFFITIGDFQIKTPLIGRHFENYDSLEEKKQLELLENFFLPIYIGHYVNKEYVVLDKIYNDEDVKTIFGEKISKLIETLAEKGVQIIEKNVTIKKTSGIWRMNVDFLTIEPIGNLEKTHLTQPEQNIVLDSQQE